MPLLCRAEKTSERWHTSLKLHQWSSADPQAFTTWSRPLFRPLFLLLCTTFSFTDGPRSVPSPTSKLLNSYEVQYPWREILYALPKNRYVTGLWGKARIGPLTLLGTPSFFLWWFFFHLREIDRELSCAYTWMRRPQVDIGNLPPLFPTLIWGRISQLILELTNTISITSQLDPGIPCFCGPQCPPSFHVSSVKEISHRCAHRPI